MRIPLLITVTLLLLLAGLGWFNQQRIKGLRTTEQELGRQMTERGISLDPTGGGDATRPSKRPRPDLKAEAKMIAADLVTYAAEPRLPDDRYSEATRLRVLAESERVMLLDGSQLKTLISELKTATDISDGMRKQFICFAIKELTKSHPQDALAILMEDTDLDLTPSSKYPPDSLIADATRGWSSIDAKAAAAWFESNREALPEKLLIHVEKALISGAMLNEPQLALQLFEESGRKPRDLSSIIDGNFHEPDGRLAFLGAFRQWRESLPEGHFDKRDLTSSMAALTFGSIDDRPLTFGSTSRWMEQAKLTPLELDHLTVMSFDQFIDPNDAGHWIQWLEKFWPEKYAKRYQSHLLNGYRTSVASAEWLISQPDGPRHREMVARCLMQALERDHDTGIRLALSLPPDDDRQKLLEGIYQRWPTDKPSSKAAAEAFANEHDLAK